MPGIRTSCGERRWRLVTRSTCTITIPPEFFVACAIESMSNVAASRSIVTLPSSSAVVPRRNATSIGRLG